MATIHPYDFKEPPTTPQGWRAKSRRGETINYSGKKLPTSV